jgi:glycerophosphoryl diester phosphodiesterase
MNYCLLLLTLSTAFVQLGMSQTKAPLIIAHRGASALAPENTLAAFRKAMELRADALEIDVRQTKDGHFIVMHDASVDRTTTGKGNVADMTFEELRRLDAGSSFDASFAREKIPTLEEVLTILDSTTLLIAELKGASDDGSTERKLVDIIRRSDKQKQVILKSFEKEVLDRFKSLSPEMPRLFVYAFRIPWLSLVVGTRLMSGSVFDVDCEYLQAHWLLLSESFTKAAQAKGFTVIAWGINDEADMREAIRYGVDGIETGKPDVLRKIIQENR